MTAKRSPRRQHIGSDRRAVGLGVSRRAFLSDIGMGFTGLALGSMLAGGDVAGHEVSPAQSPFAPKAKSVIWLFMTGGVSHMESFDPKPKAPQGIRGDFNPISTSTPGFQICEHLPMLAQRFS